MGWGLGVFDLGLKLCPVVIDKSCLKELSFGKTCSACRRGQNANKKFTDFVLKYPVDFMSNLETSRVSDYWRRWR